MDDRPNPRPTIPAWAWILAILAIILGLQLFLSRRVNAPEEIPLDRVVRLVEQGRVESIVVTGERLEVTLQNGTVYGSTKENGVGFMETLDRYQVPLEQRDFSYEVDDQSSWNALFSIGLTLIPVLLLLWIFSRSFRQMQGGGNNIFGFGRSRARNINDGDRPTVTFDDVAGVEEAKEEVQEIVQFLREPEKFVQVGARIPKGVLMVGPPGTGKTLLARAIAGEAGVPFFHISGSEFVEMFVGVGASRVRDLFNKAKEHAPSIVFVDEIDAVGRQRGAGLGGGHDEREQTLNQILVEMDGFSNETNVIVIAATNRADVLDPALLRPGRFDRKVIVDLPDIKGREDILEIHARGKPLAPEVDLAETARLTAGFSGADLENLINEAAIYAARRNKTVISRLEMQEAFDRVVMGPERKSRVISEEDKEVTAYHEAGHAIVSHFLVHTDPVQKITIIPRGGAGGYVMPLPEDRMTFHTGHFEDRIAMALGGRAAEEIFFGRVTTGASNDLKQATSMARSMVTKYGMSESLGLRTYGDDTGNVFLGRELSTTRDYSEEAAKLIDREVRIILDRNYERARDIIRTNHDRLVRLVNRLMEAETLDRHEFEQLMNEEPAPVEADGALVPGD
ncbi:MAG: ATP-dependent metallopeptidase FtsH/Yme1/Tma family protein [Chloroflexi bacterium]|nr:ATP-dependent metallopeptidase FtsH/Yme1/Tma family protein [Chloroflexota bacterium]